MAATHKNKLLDSKELSTVSDIPAEAIWLENARTRSPETARYLKSDLAQFKKFFGIESPEDYRKVTTKHIMQWKISLQFGDKFKMGDKIPKNEPSLIGNGAVARKLSSISSLFTFFCDMGAMQANPFKAIKRPPVDSNIGKSKVLNESEVRKLLEAPDPKTLKGKRDRAIFSTFLYHGLRRAEVCDLKVKNIYIDRGAPVFLLKGKGSKERRIPLKHSTIQIIYDYLEAAGHRNEPDSPLFLPLKNYKDKKGRSKHITGDGIYKIIMAYAKKVGIDTNKFHPHSLRATAATNALKNNADIVEVQKWLGHSNIQTTRIYDHRESDDDKSPTFKVSY